ncbi:hypothetical protein DOK79_001383 [Enterococcus sp. DIV1094]|uniref:HTH rpiR-type domain-containing protein n=2 Tax=Candidatus Enterococcus mangumiae TaxID=2230878 RepID=A0ABZ2SVR4_9ENTE
MNENVFLLGWMKVKTISQVYIRLNEHLFKCKKYDLNFLITKVLIERIDEFPNIYIEEIAYAAQTTPASITKFCKKLGYTSFKEMRCDLDNYFIQEYDLSSKIHEGILCGIDTKSELSEMVDRFLQHEYTVQKNIFEQFDSEQCMRIAEEIKLKKRVAILGNSYSFTVVNLLRELLSQMGYLVFEVNRNAEDQLIKQVLLETDVCFIINLTREWVEKKSYLLQDTTCKKILLTFSERADQNNLFEEVVLFKEISPMLASNYYSQKVLHLWMIFLIMSLKKK